MSFADRFAVVDAAAEALAGLVEVVHQCQGSGLGPAMGRLDVLRRLVEAAQVTVLGEGLERGEVASASCSSAAGWVLEWAPSYRSGGAGDLVRVAQACIGRPVGAGGCHVLDRGSVQRLRSCVLSGRVGVRSAAVSLAEMAKLGPRVDPAGGADGLGRVPGRGRAGWSAGGAGVAGADHLRDHGPGYRDLKDACGSGVVLGDGTLLAPETVRRIA
ncbi:MAG TPA: hypothetical protein VFK66_06885, partial [Oryzihumus sp.]|nr:hypothetical protein [Oryzihumus sp.]